MKELIQTVIPGVSPRQAEQFCRYYELLVDWNSRMNLTAITEKEDVAKKHFLDSLLAIPYLPEGASCIDVGTGAGFPGIPLAIMRPDLSMTLLDSLNKRVGFLKEVCQELGLTIQCIHSRAEDGGKSPLYRERFDIALSRAVAPLNVLLELTTPFVKVGGTAIAYKGPSAKEEMAACDRAKAVLGLDLSLMAFDAQYGERTLVMAKKIAPAPAKYPRKAGEPSKKPL